MEPEMNKPSAWLLPLGMMVLITAGALFGLVAHEHLLQIDVDDLDFDTWLNEKSGIMESLTVENTVVDHDGDPAYDDYITRSGGGSLEWKQTLHEAAGKMTSTPAFVDLNNDGRLEVVIASEGDFIYALGQGGNYFWSEPYSDDVIDYLGETAQTSGLDFDPPHIFSSVIAADVNLGDSPEVIIGVKDGALCLGANGEKQWKKGLTSGYYFSTAAITDLEGVWSGEKEDLEIVLASDDENKYGWLEAFEVDGGAIFREEAPTLTEGGLIGCSVVAHDLDGDFWDGPTLINPDLSKERDTEIIVGNHDKGLRIWERQGENSDGKPNYDESLGQNLGGHQTYATTAVANVTGGPECELFVGSCLGTAVAWNGWGGKLYAYTPEGRRLWEYSTGSARASIISSPAIADLQVAKDDPDEKVLDYEIIFGCDNGMVYVLNADDHSHLWSFQTGGRVLSSPAICNIDNDDELEIIIGSDSGKVFCLDGDPTDGIDEGQPYQGDGPTQDVLWVYDTDAPIGISSPVVADYDMDGQLEVVIGDAMGNVYCISAGGRSVTGQQDWTEFHGNLNRTGFYNPQTSFGVDIRPHRDPVSNIADSMVKSVEPGQVVTYNLTVENTGKGITKSNPDRITVKIEPRSVPDEWSAWLDTPMHKGDDNPDFVMLASQESAELTLHIQAPWEGSIGEMARINVTANSTRDLFSIDDITTLTVLNLYVDFDLAFMKTESMDPLDPLYGRKVARINPGGEGVYPVSIINKGNINDTYRISLIEPPSFTGWDWFFVETGSRSTDISLGSSIFSGYEAASGGSFNVKVICPDDSLKDTQVPIIIEGTSDLSMNSDIEPRIRNDELIMVVGEQNEIQLRIDESTKYAYPDEIVEFKLLISNTGNKDMLNVRLFIDGSISGWDVRYPEEAIPVIQGQTKTVPVRIRVPRDARAEDKLVISIIGVVEDASQYRSQAMLNVIVKQRYSFDANVLEKEGVTVDQGSYVLFSVQISNLGNGDDRIMPRTYQIPGDWNLSFYNHLGYSKYEIDLPYDDDLFMSTRLDVPTGTRTGDYMVGINLTGEGSSRIVYVKVSVNQTHDLSLKSVEGSRNINGSIAPNQERSVVVTVTNNGNGWENVDLFLGSKYDEIRQSMGVLFDGWMGKIVAVSNTPDFTTNIQEQNFQRSIVISNLVADVYYTPDRTAANASGTSLDEIREINLGLDMGMTAWVHVVLKAPSNEVNDLREVTNLEIAAVGSGPDNCDLVYIGLTVLFPDLAFSKHSDGAYVQISGDRSDGSIITIVVRITNLGDIAAENIDIVLLVDESEKKTQTLRAVKEADGVSHDVKTVIFSWVAESGEHEIRIVIDPDRCIIESSDQFIHQGANNNNELSIRIDISGGNFLKEAAGQYPIISAMLIILLAIIALVSAALVLKKKDLI